VLKSGVAAGASFFLGSIAAERLTRRPPNFFIILADALRADFVDRSVGGVAVMPNLRRLAERGTWFSNCTAPSSWTPFAVTGLLCSRAPLPNSERISPRTAYFPDDSVSFAEVLSQAGRLTRAIIKNPWLREEPGTPDIRRRLFARGFGDYHSPIVKYVDNPLHGALGGAEKDFQYERASVAVKQAINILEMYRDRLEQRPHLLYIHLMDTHEPYDPPEEFCRGFVEGRPIPGIPDSRLTAALRLMGEKRGAERLEDADMPLVERSKMMYTAAANYVDSALGKFLRYLDESGLADRSVVVFTADHGEEFGEHGWIGHGRTLYRELLAVPLVLAGPGVPRGEVVEDPVGLVDLAPALAELAEVGPIPDTYEGEAAAILGGTVRKDILSTTKYPNGTPLPRRVATSVTTRSGRKYIRTAQIDEKGNVAGLTDELYDLRGDAGERIDLAPANADYCKAASTLIDAAAAARLGAAGRAVEVPAGLEDALRSLGYHN
jgi:arylsulfatase